MALPIGSRASPDDHAAQGSSEDEACASGLADLSDPSFATEVSDIVASSVRHVIGQADTQNASPEIAAAEAWISSQRDLSLDQARWPHRHDAKFDKCSRHRGHITLVGDISSQGQHEGGRFCSPVLHMCR